jgi:hypothetical protein
MRFPGSARTPSSVLGADFTPCGFGPSALTDLFRRLSCGRLSGRSLPVPRLSARSGAPPARRCPAHLHIGGVNTLTRLPASVRNALLHRLAHHIASGLEVPSASGFDGFCSCMVCRRRPAHLTRLLTSPLCAAWNCRVFHPAGVRATCLAHDDPRPHDHARERVLIPCPAVRGAIYCRNPAPQTATIPLFNRTRNPAAPIWRPPERDA